VLALSVMTVAWCAAAAAQRPTDVIRWSAAGPDVPVKRGSSAMIRLTVDIEPGWHLYAFKQPPGGPRSLEVNAGKDAPIAIVTAKIDAPPPKVQHDPNFKLDTPYYDERTTITVPVRIAASAEAGSRRASLDIVFQACTERLCLRPYTETVTVDLTIADVAGGSTDR
jgi:DsbC/DsbD-like thiol-disulfide interchange protein